MQAVIIAQSRGSDSNQSRDLSVEHTALLTTHCLTNTQQERLSEPRASHVVLVPADHHNARRNSLPETGLVISSLPRHCHQKNVPKQTPLAASLGL